MRSFFGHCADNSSGIGLETCILFAREGAAVLMADISEPALAKGIAKVRENVPSAAKLDTVKCDVTKEPDIAAAVGHLDQWGGVDIMFNNAGIMHGEDADAIDTPERIWDLTQAINVKGVWYGSKHAVLSMRKHGKKKGSVINTASIVAVIGSATPQLAYTASKGAVLAMTRELAVVHAKEGFRFNALCPAPLKYVIDNFPWRSCFLTVSLVPLCCKTGSEMMLRRERGVRYTSQLADLVRPSNKLMLYYF